MENRRKGAPGAEGVTSAMQTAVEAATVRAKPGRKPHEPKDYGFITQRIEKMRYEELQELFGGKGLAMATAANMALMYIADMVEAG
ncbi:MAG: hypothetical protein LBK25_00675, partial [Treponema sp.]|nr:hypothetical protein [Treponema sp.]